METLKFLIFFSVICVFVSCKKIEDHKNSQKTTSVNDVKIQGLHPEAKAKGFKFNDQLNDHLKNLKALANHLKAGKKVNQEALRNLIANAEIIVNHECLRSDNQFVMMTPENASDIQTQKSLDKNQMSLERDMAILEGNAKKESNNVNP